MVCATARRPSCNRGRFFLSSTARRGPCAGDESLFAPPTQLTWEGTVDASGNLSFPAAGIAWPSVQIPPALGGDPEIYSGSIELTTAGPATGALDPAIGTLHLAIPVNYVVSVSGNILMLDFKLTCTVTRTPPALTLRLTWPP